ncbi:hypothetical protein MXB_5552, partial [Myxobolus squamalis]
YYDLFSCSKSCNHSKFCLLACLCPCIASYLLSEKLGHDKLTNSCFFIGGFFAPYAAAIIINREVRAKYRIGCVWNDILVGFCCIPCALIPAKMVKLFCKLRK